MDKQAFIADMESRFGSDKALGVRFQLESGEILSVDEYDALVKKLGKHDAPCAESLLPDDGSAVCCTDYAAYIFKQLPGRVEIYGFANEDNPTSRVAREEIHLSGHDYAIVDGRYIVDPWPRLVPMAFEQMVFDLEDEADAALVADIYGPRSCWERMSLAEQYAQEQLDKST
jgi:hypothetical protein